MEAVTVKNLSFRYPETGVDVLKSIDFSIKGGEFVTLCGLSGSGKSTLLRQLKPALAPHGVKQGDILINGKPIAEMTLREQSETIGFVQQNPDTQIVTDKVWHELAFGLESLGLPTEIIRRRVAETASFFGIQQYFERDVSQLSGGQKQLLNLASVMAMQPSLLLLDEPTAQLDPIAAADFLACLLKINREIGTTVIITEHRLEDILPISDRVLVIENGEIISDDIPANTGANLRQKQSGCFLSLPAPMRIWDAVESVKSSCPVTVAQGKAWLKNFASNHPLYELPPESIPPHGETVIKIKNAWFRYKKDAPDVIKNLSLEVHAGEFLTIMGGNGTGKSTLLSLINGSSRPYRGEVNSNSELCLTLPQNPQMILDGKTVHETLSEVFDGSSLSKEEQQSRLQSVVDLCEIGGLLSRHSFDLSGGESQKVALAKLLLLQPKLLLLDEPTKGLDAQFKAAFAAIISTITQAGTAVVMISHDLEFCAKYSHRCMMLFNGELITQDTPRRFFSTNSFYVTSASRMASEIIPEAVTAEDVIYCCTGKTPEPPPKKKLKWEQPESAPVQKEKQPFPLWKKLFGIFGSVSLLFGILQNLNYLPFLPAESLPLWTRFSLIAVPVILLMIAFGSLSKRPVDKPQKQKLSKRTIAAAVSILLLIPATIYIGNVFLYDQKYLFISLLVLLECMLPFFLVFEGRKPQARELVIIAVLCALTVAGRSAFVALPQIKPVLALVIISGVAFGGETGFIVGAVGMLVSNIYFGQGAWTPWQMFAAGIIGFLAGVLFRKGFLARGRGALCFFGFIVTIVIYGGIMNFSSLVLSHVPITLETAIAYYAQGLPFDIVHAFSTTAFLFFFALPMLEKLDRVKTKYGLIQ